MDKLLITGGARLEGEIPISGAKNAALPLMACALMAEQGMVLDNLPALADTNSMCELLNHLAVETTRQGETVHFAAASAAITDAPYEIVSKCEHLFWCWGLCWRDMAERAFPCPEDARLARALLICISWAWNGWGQP